MRQRRQAELGHGLAKEEQAPEPLLKVAVKEARPRPEGLGISHQPEMRDPLRRKPALHEVGQQGVIALAAMFRGQGVAFLAGPGKGIAGVWVTTR